MGNGASRNQPTMAVPERPAGLSERPRAQEPLVSDAPPAGVPRTEPLTMKTEGDPGPQPPRERSEPEGWGTGVSGAEPLTMKGGTALSAPLAPGAYPAMLNTRPPPPVQMIAPPPKPDRTLLWVGLGVGGFVMIAGIVIALALVVFAAAKPSAAGTTPALAPAQPASLQLLPRPGPIEVAPAPILFVTNPSLDAKLSCPAGATLHRADNGVSSPSVFCADAAGTREGPSLVFESKKKGARLLSQDSFSKGRREGQCWTFSAGEPTTVAEYRSDLLHGEKLTIAAHKIVAREHYANGQRDGLAEYWSATTLQPTQAQLYKNGLVVGQSP